MKKFSNEQEAAPRRVADGLTIQQIMSLLASGVVCYSTSKFVTDDLVSDSDVDDYMDFSRDGRLDAMDIQGLSGSVARLVLADDESSSVQSTDGGSGGTQDVERQEDSDSNESTTSL